MEELEKDGTMEARLGWYVGNWTPSAVAGFEDVGREQELRKVGSLKNLEKAGKWGFL